MNFGLGLTVAFLDSLGAGGDFRLHEFWLPPVELSGCWVPPIAAPDGAVRNFFLRKKRGLFP